jgi:hypothetical protein
MCFSRYVSERKAYVPNFMALNLVGKEQFLQGISIMASLPCADLYFSMLPFISQWPQLRPLDMILWTGWTVRRTVRILHCQIKAHKQAFACIKTWCDEFACIAVDVKRNMNERFEKVSVFVLPSTSPISTSSTSYAEILSGSITICNGDCRQLISPQLFGEKRLGCFILLKKDTEPLTNHSWRAT